MATFAKTVTLTLAGQEYNLLGFSYSFYRNVDSKGRPMTRRNLGGEIVVHMEATRKNDELLELFFNNDRARKRCTFPNKVSGKIEVADVDDGMILRQLVFEEAYICSTAEHMEAQTPVPMTQSFVISPLRLDINKFVRMDRRFDFSPHGWEEYVPQPKPKLAAAPAKQPELPECSVFFRRKSDYDGSFGFDWLRVGDTDEPGCGWYKNSMPTVADYDNFVTQYERFTQSWRTRNETYRATAQYVVPWMTLMPGHTARLRVKMQVNVPSGNLSVCIQGSAIGNLSINMRTMPADRTGDYYLDTDLEITCTGSFATQSSLEVYATGHELVGKLNFLPNANIRPVDVAIVTVKTKNGTDIHRRAPSQEILDSMTRLLGQAYIDPQFKHYTLDLSGPVITKTVKERANISRNTMVDKIYINAKAYGIDDAKSKRIDSSHKTTDTLFEILWGKSINTNEANGINMFGTFHDFLNKMFHLQDPTLAENLKDTVKLYFINRPVFVPGLGDVKGEASNIGGKEAYISEDGYNGASPTHELLHCLSLHEAFPNEDHPNDPSKNGLHVFTKTKTDNIMDYDWNDNNIEDRISLWAWQIKQLARFLK
jgi:hypothetical protein